MPTPFQTALADTLDIEGGYSDHPSDRGGATRYGITESLARAYDYEGAMSELPFETAERIYQEHFWEFMRLERVAVVDAALAEEVFDTAVNVGRGRAGTWFQRLLNALNRKESIYADIAVDGAIGPVTLRAFQAYVDYRGDEGIDVFKKGFNALRGEHYIALAEADGDQEAFVFGWLRTRL
ncbi:MAG: glycosyl hydrolase 108 family protein [Rhodothermales bacterium]